MKNAVRWHPSISRNGSHIKSVDPIDYAVGLTLDLDRDGRRWLTRRTYWI